MDCSSLLQETDVLAAINARHKQKDIWTDSVFEGLRYLSSRAKGAAGEKMVSELLSKLGFVVRPKTKQGDRLVIRNGIVREVEIKTSLAWDNQPGKFTWQQLRDQDYDRVIFLGINPNDAVLYWADKSALVAEVFNDGHRQHAGKNGGQALYWISTSSRIPLPNCLTGNFSAW